MIDNDGQWEDDAGGSTDSDSFMEKLPLEGRIIHGVNPEFSQTFNDQPLTSTGVKKPRNPMRALVAGFGNERIWSVQHWTRRDAESPESLWPSHVYNGLTYEQARIKVAELTKDNDPELNSVEIAIRFI